MNNLNEKKLFRISTYAKMKNISGVCVLNWIKSGKVKTIKIDNTIFIIEEG